MRLLKRGAAIIAALLFVSAGLSAACVSRSDSPVQTVKIGVALYRNDDTFILSMVKYLEEFTKAKEIETGKKIALDIVDASNSQSYQNTLVDTFIDQSCDVMCVNMVDRTAAAVIVNKAMDADIPVIFFNREPVEEDIRIWSKAYYVGTDAKEGAVMQGNIVADYYWEHNRTPLAVDKNEDGLVQYVILEGEQGHQDALIRTEYSVKTISDRGINLDKLANDTANWQRSQAKAKMLAWMDKFGDEIELVLSNNDDMALGAVDALIETGVARSEMPVIVGIDATLSALEAVESGALAGTVVNDAVGQSRAILELAFALACGVEPPDEVNIEDAQYVRVPHRPVTRDTAQKEKQYLLGDG